MSSARPDKIVLSVAGKHALTTGRSQSMKYFMESSAPQAKIAQMKEKFGMD
jgi:hypothetical protein